MKACDAWLALAANRYRRWAATAELASSVEDLAAVTGVGPGRLGFSGIFAAGLLGWFQSRSTGTANKCANENR